MVTVALRKHSARPSDEPTVTNGTLSNFTRIFARYEGCRAIAGNSDSIRPTALGHAEVSARIGAYCPISERTLFYLIVTLAVVGDVRHGSCCVERNTQVLSAA